MVKSFDNMDFDKVFNHLEFVIEKFDYKGKFTAENVARRYLDIYEKQK